MEMARRLRNWWSHSKTVALIWTICILLSFSSLQMALKYSPSPPSSYSLLSTRELRSRLYDRMARDLDEHGAAFVKQGKTSQSLSLSDIFTLKDGSVTPVLKAANPPVRANVLYLNSEYSIPISEAVKNIFGPYFGKAIWFQNSSVYHFSMFHASHHISPVPATEEEIEAEAGAVRAVTKSLCPLKIILDRVVLTSTGVLLGCWQVTSGSDPITIRDKLRSALPRSPEKQLYDVAILHTSLARLLGPPNISSMDEWGFLFPYKQNIFLRTLFSRFLKKEPTNQLQFFHDLVTRLNDKIRGFKAVVSELWYVEEYDLLALALDGRTKVRRFQLGCKHT